MKDKIDFGCCGCGRSFPNVSLINGKPTWFGSYENSRLVQFVCIDCHEQGIKLDLQHEKKTYMGGSG